MTSLDLFRYELPSELIAQRPADQRDASRLMALNRSAKTITHHQFTAFPDMFKKGDVLAFNTSRVFPARLEARRMSGGKLEILLVRPHEGNVWSACVRGLAKIKPGETVVVEDCHATLVEKLDGGQALFRFPKDTDVEQLAERIGSVPLPPYIHRPDGRTDDDDRRRYQTVYASQPGSCAAPTAGLHFTQTMIEEFRGKGVELAPLTLHVGPGTFKPVKTDAIENHVMDYEEFAIPEKTAQIINIAKAQGRRVIAVGSTTARTLESAVDESGKLSAVRGETSLYITPGYRFKVVDALLTNFHLPGSTLLILVSAFAGRRFALQAYDEAVRRRYRFYSYGDAMFIE